jgi:hypothetical protein
MSDETTGGDMSNTRNGIDIYTVHHREPFEDEEPGMLAGVLRIDSDHHIDVVSAEPPFADTLELAAEMINEADEFMVRTIPPPETPPASCARAVARDTPEARAAVLDILRDEYGFELSPAT